MSASLSEILTDCPAKKTNSRRSFRGLSIEERQLERKLRIKDAALELYGTRGFFAVKVKDICVEAGLTERYFYESFDNAEALFKAIYEDQVEKLKNKTLGAILSVYPDVSNMVKVGLSAFFSEIQNDGRVARILFLDALHVSSVAGKSIHDAMSNFETEIQRFVKVNYPNLRISPTGSLMLTGLNGYATAIALRWVLEGFSESFEDVLNSCLLVCMPILQATKQEDSGFFIKK